MSDCRTWSDAYEDPCGRCDVCQTSAHRETVSRMDGREERIEQMLEAICDHLGVPRP